MKRKMYFLCQAGMEDFLSGIGLMIFAFCSGRGSNFLVVASTCALAAIAMMGSANKD